MLNLIVLPLEFLGVENLDGDCLRLFRPTYQSVKACHIPRADVNTNVLFPVLRDEFQY